MRNLSIVKKKFFDYVDNIIDNNKVSHAYIIEVDNYDDNMIDIYDFVKMILFDKKLNELKQINEGIIKFIDNNEYPDIKLIEPDGNNIRKGQLIELQKEYSNKSTIGNKRIYIIKEAERMKNCERDIIIQN